jgi:hypothetical protein
MEKLLIVWSLTLVGLTATGQTKIKVPYGSASVMVDGKFENNEWNDAYHLPVTDSLALYIKQDKENIYWCLRGFYQPQVLAGVNFYITDKDSLLNFHASAKLGERTLRKGSYGEWDWWNNKGWTATVARPQNAEERKYLRDGAKEFQLRKSRFGDKHLRMMFDIEFPRDLVPAFPRQATVDKPDQWLFLEL